MLRLSMRFVTENGEVAIISVRNAKSNLEEGEVTSLMNTIVESNVFQMKSGSIVSKKDAKLIETKETQFNIA